MDCSCGRFVRNLWRVPCVCLAEPSLNPPLTRSMGFPRTPPVASHAERGSRFGRNDMKGEFMRAVFAGAALAAFVITPTLADYYIVQEPRVGVWSAHRG
jgi:hypothetical protein